MKTVLITGAARRLGAEISRTLHKQGFNVILHYRDSTKEVTRLYEELNTLRSGSAEIWRADLLDLKKKKDWVEFIIAFWGRLDALINNASAFYPTPMGKGTLKQWDDLINTNMKAPFFLTQALAPELEKQRGSVINIIDIHAEKGLKDYPIYSIAKAGLAGMTRIVAKELAPNIRVNGISPGAILWPEAHEDQQVKDDILKQIPMQTIGNPSDIAKAVLFLLLHAPYVTGQIIEVDGGRTLFN